MNNVITQEEFDLDYVLDDSTEKRDVAAGADRHPDISQRARARESWIDMNDGRAAFFCLHHPAKTDWMRLGHGGAFDQNAIGISEILLRSRSSAPAKGGAQTGHRAAMSYPRLIGYAHHPQAESEQFSDKIVFFDVERGTAEMTHRGGVIDRDAVLFVDEGAFACFPNTVRHHVHGAIERNLRPLFGTRRAIFHFSLAP